MSEADAKQPKPKQPPKWEDTFFLQWGPESLKGSVPTLNDALGKVITLASALIGGGFLLAKGETIPFGWAISAIALMLICLVAALLGMNPRSWNINLNSAHEIRSAEYGAITWKTWCLRVSLIALFLSFVVAFVGVIDKGSAEKRTDMPAVTETRPN